MGRLFFGPIGAAIVAARAPLVPAAASGRDQSRRIWRDAFNNEAWERAGCSYGLLYGLPE
jgi:hypothetical protein